MIVWYISLLIAGALAGAPETSSEHSTQDRTENIRVTWLVIVFSYYKPAAWVIEFILHFIATSICMALGLY